MQLAVRYRIDFLKQVKNHPLYSLNVLIHNCLRVFFWKGKKDRSKKKEGKRHKVGTHFSLADVVSQKGEENSITDIKMKKKQSVFALLSEE